MLLSCSFTAVVLNSRKVRIDLNRQHETSRLRTGLVALTLNNEGNDAQRLAMSGYEVMFGFVSKQVLQEQRWGKLLLPHLLRACWVQNRENAQCSLLLGFEQSSYTVFLSYNLTEDASKGRCWPLRPRSKSSKHSPTCHKDFRRNWRNCHGRRRRDMMSSRSHPAETASL